MADREVATLELTIVALLSLNDGKRTIAPNAALTCLAHAEKLSRNRCSKVQLSQPDVADLKSSETCMARNMTIPLT